MEPKFSFSPEANEAAMPSVVVVAATSRFRILAAAAAQARLPMVEVACQPRS